MATKLSDKKKRDLYLTYIKKHLECSIATMQYYKAIATTRKGKLQCNKSIKQCEQALVYVNTISHVDILEYLFFTYVGNNVILYSISGSVAITKKIKMWDTKEHHGEFLEFIKETKENYIAKQKAREENMQAIKKAKEEGKKVEMVWDNKEKRAKPLIVGENNES